jgi:MOSC domain-containing protein YiiM
MANRAGSGRVEHIHLTSRGSEPMRSVARVRAIAGIGLEGDRYAAGLGFYSNKPPGTGRALTLIEAETLDALRAELGIELQPGDSRRNLTIRGIELNPLVGKRFRIGGVLCQGVRFCVPCQYLVDLIGKPVLAPLVDRGGLRADILEGGEIRVGDELRPLPEGAP